MIRSRVVVRRYARGWDTWQHLIRQWFIGPLKIWSQVIDREDVPQHVYIQFLCFGDWNGWQSKFAEWIDSGKKENAL